MDIKETYIAFRDACRKNGWSPGCGNGDGMIKSYAWTVCDANSGLFFPSPPEIMGRIEDIRIIERMYGKEPETKYFTNAFRREMLASMESRFELLRQHPEIEEADTV